MYKLRNKFQLTYILIFIICLFGFIGNVQIGVETSRISLIILTVTGFLTVGKVIYLSKKYECERLWKSMY